MQKKLYYLDEEEKQRILNLHENRIKKHYLTEAVNRENEINKVLTMCQGITGDLDNNEKLIRDKFYAATTGSGFMSKSTYNELNGLLQKIPNKTSFCKIHNSMAYQNGSNFVKNLSSYISWDGSFMTTMNKIFAIPKTNPQTNTQNNKFTKFPCVAQKNPNGKYENGKKGLKYVLQSGLDFYSFYDTGAFFITKPNGTELPEGDNKYYKYSCEKNGSVMYEDTSGLVDINGNPINSSNTQGGTQGGTNTNVGTNNFGVVIPNVITTDKLTDLRKTLGLPGTSNTLTQEDINKLYDTITKS